MKFLHSGPESLRLGIVYAEQVRPEGASPHLSDLIEIRLSSLSNGLSQEQDTFRMQVRDIFRNGKFKPTGRAKPASEYLLRAASELRFPRINLLVDCCNYLSIASLLPISIWDIDRSKSSSFNFRLGFSEEEFVFNEAGHVISHHDLIVGCAVGDEDSGVPIVNAVKDSMATKTTDSTTHVAAAIYAPLNDGPDLSLREVCEGFADIFNSTTREASSNWMILMAGESGRF